MGRATRNIWQAGLIWPVTVGNPGAGLQFTYILPAGYDYMLRSAYMELNTSAVVASRNLGLKMQDSGAANLMNCRNNTNVTAGATWRYTFGIGLSQTVASAQYFQIPIPDMAVPGGYSVLTEVLAMDAGDTLTNIRLIFLRAVQ